MTNKEKIVYFAGGMSPVHLLQVVSLAFCVGGCLLAFKLGSGPQQALISSTSVHDWAVGLALTALTAPVMTWVYGRKIATRIALSVDGKSVLISDANLLGNSNRRWPLSALQLVGFSNGDPGGEEVSSPPRVTLVAKRGNVQRAYILPLRGRKQAAEVRRALHL